MERLTYRSKNQKGLAYFDDDGSLIRGANGRFHQKRDMTAHYIHQRFVALDKAIDRLAAYEDTGLTPEEIMALLDSPNPPLTLEELRKMDGEPVWVTCFDSWRLCYGLSDYRGYLCMEIGNGSCILMKDYGEKWLAYRSKPEGADLK